MRPSSCSQTGPRSGTHRGILRPRVGFTPTSCPGKTAPAAVLTGGMRGRRAPGLWRGRAALRPPTPAQDSAFPSPLSRCQSRPVTHPHPQRSALNPTGSRGICQQQLPPRAGAEPAPPRWRARGQARCRTSPEGPGFQPRSRPEVRSVQPSPSVGRLKNKEQSPCLHSPGNRVLTASQAARPIPWAALAADGPSPAPQAHGPSPTHLYVATRRRSEGARW